MLEGGTTTVIALEKEGSTPNDTHLSREVEDTCRGLPRTITSGSSRAMPPAVLNDIPEHLNAQKCEKEERAKKKI